MTEDTNIKSQMRKGILEYCVLLLLSRGKAYPSDIIKSLSEASLIVVEGTLYTLLNRLRKERKLSYEWQESTMGPPRKYYSITPLGLQSLEEMGKAWDEIVQNVNHFRNLSSTGPQSACPPSIIAISESFNLNNPDQNETND